MGLSGVVDSSAAHAARRIQSVQAMIGTVQTIVERGNDHVNAGAYLRTHTTQNCGKRKW